MKFTVILATVALCLLPNGSRGDDPAAEKDQEAKAKLVGTWKNISEGIPQQYTHLKHLNPTHFIWVLYDNKTMSTIGAAGGTWSLKGDKYTERIAYASDGWEHLRGKEITFTLKREGDKFFQTGEFDQGTKIDETWDRQK
jgi:hypothetical protein